jgi:hypothetical protein
MTDKSNFWDAKHHAQVCVYWGGVEFGFPIVVNLLHSNSILLFFFEKKNKVGSKISHCSCDKLNILHMGWRRFKTHLSYFRLLFLPKKSKCEFP